MAQEYRLEEVLLALEDIHVLDSLLKQRGTLESFEYYNNNPIEIVNEIMESSKYTNYIKGLISIYPLSSGILKEMMNICDLSLMREDVFAWLDVSDTLKNMTSKFYSLCSKGIQENGEESELEAEIAELEKQKESLEEERIKYKENEKRYSAMRQEVEALKMECAELENKYSPDIIKKEKEKYERERVKFQNKNKEVEAKLKKLKEEMEPYRDSGNERFDKAMEAFSKVVSTLPKDEG